MYFSSSSITEYTVSKMDFGVCGKIDIALPGVYSVNFLSELLSIKLIICFWAFSPDRVFLDTTVEL